MPLQRARRLQRAVRALQKSRVQSRLFAFKAALSRYEFTCSDFETIDVQPLDFVYADPPYDVEFTSYFAGGFDWEAQERLATGLLGRGPVVASNQVTDRVLNCTASGFYG